MKNFTKVNPKQSFPKLEEEILDFWQENKIFEESVENRKDAPEFNFYDGPPFATGTPHYWHILAGTIKDVIPRYQTMAGFRVERKFGWDCHGLPIENIVEKKLKISWKDDIEKNIWVYKFNEECRANVFTYAKEWEKTVKRMGRWVDMENDYKTMDTNFMESVWWVYKTIYDKGLIYEGHRVVPYCPRCTTPLSNFEVNQGYKDKQSKTVTLKFKAKWSENKYFLAWTTTAWTVPAVLALAVGKDLDYCEILDKKSWETYVIAKARISSYYKNEEDYTIVREYKWECLLWIEIEPVFDDFKIQLQEMWKDLWPKIELWKNAFKVVAGHHVTTDAWTWIVTTAPGYWEDDFIVARDNDVWFVSHIWDDWKTCNMLDDKDNWVPVFDFNEIALKYLKDSGKTIHIWTIDHSYPHCWRCDTPLIYRGISAWYVAVEKIRDKMVANNQEINWNPDSIKNGRFGKWVEWARDWNISRNRYWGSAIPVWQNEDKTSEVCIGSIKEMYELNKEYGQIEEKNWIYTYTNSGEEVDIHKHFVDEVFLKDENNFKAKNVLGIHGFTWNIETNDFWKKMKENFSKDWINIDLPQFPEKRNTYYHEWEKILNDIDFSKYDTIISHSLWTRVISEYLLSKNITNIKRLILVSPTDSWNRTDWTAIPELVEFYKSFKNNDLSKVSSLVEEIIAIHSKDDQSVPFNEGKHIANIIW
jgi:isoleucyl-tRNA synthetase